MKKYFAITFLCRDDAIILKNSLNKLNIKGELIGAPQCVLSKCSYVLAVKNIDASQLKKAINLCNNSYKDIYCILVTNIGVSCQKI